MPPCPGWLPAAAAALLLAQAALAGTPGKSFPPMHQVPFQEHPGGAQAPSVRGRGLSLSIGRCALGTAQACFDALLLGLRPEDRPYVRLVTAVGNDPAAHIWVDDGRKSDSRNFKVLKKIANADYATVLDVLAPTDTYTIKTKTRLSVPEPEPVSGLMGHPDTDDGFLGYTFFPYLGTVEPGIIYSAGDYTNVMVNARQERAAIAVSIHHEFRHVALGRFGRRAPAAMHTEAGVTEKTDAAEAEARENAEN